MPGASPAGAAADCSGGLCRGPRAALVKCILIARVQLFRKRHGVLQTIVLLHRPSFLSPENPKCEAEIQHVFQPNKFMP